MGAVSNPFDEGAGVPPPDADAQDASPSETPGAAVTPRANFCTRCGAPWDPSWTECPLCARATVTSSASVPMQVFRRDRPLRSALSLYFVLLATSAVSLILIVVEAASEAAAMLTTAVVDSVIVVVWLRGSFRSVRAGLVCTGKAGHYLLGVVLGGVTYLVAAGCVKVLTALLGVEEIRYSGMFLDAGYGWGTVMLVVCVQPAVMEELAFRGVVLSGLQGILGLTTAVIVSSFMFMILHLTPLSFPHLLVIGLVLGWLRVRSGSLYPCMVMHFTHNLLCVLTEMGGG